MPLGFTLSPLLAWAVQWHGLTVLLAATILPLAEWWFGPGRPTASVPAWGKMFPRLLLILALLVSFGLASQAGSQSWTDLALLALSCGYVLGGIGIVLAHELGHRRSWADRALARLLLLSLTYGHYALEHNRGHHRGAATHADPATARQEEGLWVYLPRYLSGVFRDAVRLSRGQPGPLNEALALMAASAALFAFMAWLGGIKTLAFCAIQAAFAIVLVASIDYVEHWGLVRSEVDGKPERMGAAHIWDCANRVSDLMLFNLPRHAAHHLQPWLDCDRLYRQDESPQMPLGYAGMSLLAMVPPLYKRVMTPRLPKPKTSQT